MIYGTVIHTASKTMGSVAMSSGESELYSLCSAIQEALFLRNLLTESGLGQEKMLTNLYTDSTAAKSIVSRMGPGKRSKHIELRYLFIQELVMDGQVKVHKVHTSANTADLMTKYLTGDVTRTHSYSLGCHPVSEFHDITG